MTGVWIVFICSVCIILYLLMILPCVSRREQMRPFEHVLIAHRGLFDNHSDAPENSIAAFRKAIESGFGIELDVQMSSDGQLFVFHDENLDRMTGRDGRAIEHTYGELSQLTLGSSKERIPLFSDVLQLVDGRVPMVIEIKVGLNYRRTTAAAAEMLKSYGGTYCIECFNPLALCWYKRHMPHILRGQLSMDYKRKKVRIMPGIGFLLTNLMLNFLARPDFIAYDHKDKRKNSFRLCRAIYKVKTAAWTIRSQQELEQARDAFDVFIFDGFLPEVKV